MPLVPDQVVRRASRAMAIAQRRRPLRITNTTTVLRDSKRSRGRRSASNDSYPLEPLARRAGGRPRAVRGFERALRGRRATRVSVSGRRLFAVRRVSGTATLFSGDSNQGAGRGVAKRAGLGDYRGVAWRAWSVAVSALRACSNVRWGYRRRVAPRPWRWRQRAARCERRQRPSARSRARRSRRSTSGPQTAIAASSSETFATTALGVT